MRPNPAAPPSTRERRTIVLAFLGLTAFFIAGGAGKNFVDPDAWHQMALARQALNTGHLPTRDAFAFTSSVEPLVHHEWGTGFVLYLLFSTVGAFGFALLRELLTVGIVAGVVLTARRRGAGHPAIWGTSPVAIILIWVGLTTVRAQMFTLLFLAWLLWFLEIDRAGRRWWIAPWLLMYVLWVNLHAGFVVGAGAFGAYTLEQLMKRRPAGHLVAIGLAMIALVALNPYGLDYYSYLWTGLSLDRSSITEWRSVLSAGIIRSSTYGVSVLTAVYALYRVGFRRVTDVLFLVAAAYAAARHQRHLSIYGVAWACFVPALLDQSRLGDIFRRALAPESRRVAAGAVAAVILGFAAYLQHRPWAPTLPANPGDHAILLYPVGAVTYLRDHRFTGNLVTPFEVGAYVSWELFPRVLVSIDGRYEVAYDPPLLDRHVRFFRAETGWQAFLKSYPADAVLTRADAAVGEPLRRLTGWHSVYRDDAYEVFAAEPSGLPVEDHRGEVLPTVVR